MATKKTERAVFRIELSRSAVATLADIKSSLGITEIAMCSKLITWLADQPDAIKLQILGVFPDLPKEDAVELILKRIAG